jgi:nucleoside-diphosphate-sugar epimerase
MGKKVVITGGAGFIGSNISQLFIERGYETHLVDIDYSFRDSLLPPSAIRHMVDIRKTDELQQIFEGADVVLHTAAVPRVPYSIEHPTETTDQNITGTVSVLTAAARAEVRRVVYSSSGSSYGNQTSMPLVETMEANPVHPYGLQKYVGELFAAMWHTVYGIETVSLRYFNVYGPGLDPNGPYALAIGKFLMAAKNNEPITIYGDGTITRDFTHVSDVANANLLAAESKNVGKGEVLNIGAGKQTTIQALAEMFSSNITYGPPRIESHDSVADNTKARQLLGWAPAVTVEEGVAALKKEHGVA